jgi:hypothetical protein
VKGHRIFSINLMKFVGEFVQPKGLEGNFPYIYLFYWDLMVARLRINLIEVFSPLDLIKDIVNSRNQVLVPDYDFV